MIVKKLVMFIKIFCSKTLVRYSYTFTYIYRVELKVEKGSVRLGRGERKSTLRDDL